MKLLMTGTKGFARDLLGGFRYDNYIREVTLFDNVSTDVGDILFGEYKILKSEEELLNYFKNTSPFFIAAVASPRKRQEVATYLKSLGGHNFTYISSKCLISRHADISEDGVIIQLDCEISSGVTLHRGVFLNVRVLVGHDVEIGEYTTISPSVNLLGNVKIGKNCVIATGVTVMPNVTIGNNVKIGMNMLIKENVEDNSIIM